MLKHAIVVPTWLGMSQGKIVSQCCHVALKYGRFEDKRVILKAGHGQVLGLVAHALEKDVTVGFFRDYNPTTEGTEGLITAWSFRGPEDAVTEVTGKLELY